VLKTRTDRYRLAIGLGEAQPCIVCLDEGLIDVFRAQLGCSNHKTGTVSGILSLLVNPMVARGEQAPLKDLAYSRAFRHEPGNVKASSRIRSSGRFTCSDSQPEAISAHCRI